MASEYRYDVFISCNRADQEWVDDELLPGLETAGLQVATADRDFEIGVSKLVNIERTVDDSHHTLVVLTPDWVDSEWAEFESLLAGTADAAHRKRKLLPLMLRPCTPPRRIAMLTYTDFTDPVQRDEQMERLIHSLRIKARVFISYHRGVEPDEPLPDERLARHLCAALERAGYGVFIDQKLPIGVEWAAELERQIRACDFMLVLLSEASVHSEVMVQEVQCAYENHRQSGKSRLLPVRLAYREPFDYPLGEYLNHINWGFWGSDEDTPRLGQEVLEAISGGELTIDAEAKAEIIRVGPPPAIPRPRASAQRVRLELPEGTMDPESAFYVERLGDQVALETIERQGVTITIKAPRQMGKSSLLICTMDAAEKLGKQVAFLDFQLFEKSVLKDADAFYRQFCLWLTDEVELDDRVEEYWQAPLGNSQRCTRYMSRYLLKELDAPLLLAMDEVDSIFDTKFRTDFFSMLRSWHNRRRRRSVWGQLDLALVTSTEPYQLVEDLNQSPFNVGEVIELTDFAPDQVADLNCRHGSPLTPEQERQLMELLNGHPYLTRRALYLVASGRISAPELFDRACEDRGPFGDHLRYHLFRLHRNEALIQCLRRVIQGHACPNEEDFFRLRGAGLVRRKGRKVVPRCQLYADYFRERLDG